MAKLSDINLKDVDIISIFNNGKHQGIECNFHINERGLVVLYSNSMQVLIEPNEEFELESWDDIPYLIKLNDGITIEAYKIKHANILK